MITSYLNQNSTVNSKYQVNNQNDLKRLKESKQPELQERQSAIANGMKIGSDKISHNETQQIQTE